VPDVFKVLSFGEDLGEAHKKTVLLLSGTAFSQKSTIKFASSGKPHF